MHSSFICLAYIVSRGHAILWCNSSINSLKVPFPLYWPSKKAGEVSSGADTEALAVYSFDVTEAAGWFQTARDMTTLLYGEESLRPGCHIVHQPLLFEA